MTDHADIGTLGPAIGRPIERREDERFLQGRGEYVGDLPHQTMLHAVVARSTVAHGRLRAIDARAALALPGVVAVFTAADIGRAVPRIPLRQEVRPELKPYEQPVIAIDQVRYVGEPIAVVIAQTQALAEDALDALEPDIEPLTPVTTRDAGHCVITLTGLLGDADAAFATAPYTRRERFSVHRHTGTPMETRGLIAEWDATQKKLTVQGAMKVPHVNRRILAEMLALPEDAVELVENDAGGGFGVRGEFYPEDFLIPFAAMRLARPVRWIEDRREHFLATNHARDADCELEIACTREGKILGLRGRARTDVGAYLRTVGVTPSRNVAQVCTGPYRIPNVHLDVSVMLTNKTPVATYRAPGRFETDFFRERMLDLAAADLGLDRVEFRRRNLVTSAEQPYALPTVQPYDDTTSTDSGDYRETLERCLSEFDWSTRAAASGKLIDGRYHGVGLGCYIEGGASGPREHARLVLESDGMVSVYTGASAVGQGLETTLAQIAADALGFPLERIRGVFHGSTKYIAEGFGTYSSRATVMGGSAIVLAAGKLLEAMRTATPGETLSVEASFDSRKRTYSYGAHAAHVAVDPKTGRVELLEYVAVEDVGRIINPLTLHGQTIGAIVQGLGGVLLEALVYNADGQLETATFADYLLPSASDFPNIRTVALEQHPSPNNPLGAKGAGEGGIIPVGGVMANAIGAALAPLGITVRDLPLSPDRIWQLIKEKS